MVINLDKRHPCVDYKVSIALVLEDSQENHLNAINTSEINLPHVSFFFNHVFYRGYSLALLFLPPLAFLPCH